MIIIKVTNFFNSQRSTFGCCSQFLPVFKGNAFFFLFRSINFQVQNAEEIRANSCFKSDII